MTDTYFDDLELDTIKRYAKGWADRFPALHSLSLYKGSIERGDENEYVFVAFYSTQDKEEAIRFLNWQNETCMHIQEAIGNFYKKKKPSVWFHGWTWLPIPEEHPLELYEDFIVEESYVPLFKKTKQESPESFVKNLIISVEDEQNLRIQVSGKAGKPYNYSVLGFSKAGEAWKSLIGAIKTGEFYIPQTASSIDKSNPVVPVKIPNKEYGKRMKLMRQVELKLGGFIAREFGLKEKPKLFQPSKGTQRRLYTPLFNLKKPPLSNLSVKELLAKLSKLTEEYKDEDEIQNAAIQALQKGASKDDLIEHGYRR